MSKRHPKGLFSEQDLAVQEFNRIFRAAEQNLARSKRIVEFVEQLNRIAAKDDVVVADVLRAAVVLCHATLEDALRIIGRKSLQNTELSNRVALKGYNAGGGAKKYELRDLLAFKGKTVETIITESIDDFLQCQTFNSTENILRFLSSISVEPAVSRKTDLQGLDEMIARRHKIVHECDLETTGHHRQLRQLTPEQVKGWIEITRLFLIAISNDFTERQSIRQTQTKASK